MTENTPLIEQADTAFAKDQFENALRYYASILQKDPSDRYIWYRTAATLARLGEVDSARRSLERLPTVMAESGRLLQAFAALKDLEALDSGAAKRSAAEVAQLYGAGSARIDQRKAPPPVRKRSERSLGGEIATADPRVLRTLAEEACERAHTHFAGVSSAGASLPYHPLLSDLQAVDLAEIASMMTLHVFADGARVVNEGDSGDSIYIVARGVAEVRRGDVQLAFLRSGAFFGEMALLTRSPRSASVVAHGPLMVLELGREALENLAASKPDVAGVLGEYTRRRLLENLMATSPLFAPLDVERRKELMGLFGSQVYGPGQTVLVEGGPSEGLYVVLGGSVRISKKEEGDNLALAELSTGQVFGEISLIQRREATATVTALTKAVILVLTRDDFNAHVGKFPEVLAHVYKLASEREASNVEVSGTSSVSLEEADSVLI